jgi:hypothetical protein
MTTDRPRTASERAVAYVARLGVDEVYQRANEAVDTLEDRLAIMHTTAVKRREIDAQIADRELHLVTEQSGTWEGSQAALDRHLKVVFNEDGELRGLRSARLAVSSEHERAEADAELARVRARVEAARLEELGGRMRFFASVSITTANDTDETDKTGLTS